MANGVSIPPWLNIDPLRPATGFLQGFQTGSSAGAARRSAELQAQAMAMREAQAAIENQLARERIDQQRAEFTATLRQQQEKAEREAAAAARQALAMRQYKADVMGGMPEAQAAARNPDIFGTSMGGFGSAISAWERASQSSIPPTFVPAGGYQAPGDVPFSFQGDPSDLVGLEGAPAHWRTATGIRSVPVGTQPKEGELTEVETTKLRGLQQELNKVNTTLSDPIRSAIAENTKKGRVQELQKERADIQAKIDTILNKDQPVAPPPKPTGKRYIWDESTRRVKLVE